MLNEKIVTVICKKKKKKELVLKVNFEKGVSFG